MAAIITKSTNGRKFKLGDELHIHTSRYGVNVQMSVFDRSVHLWTGHRCAAGDAIPALQSASPDDLRELAQAFNEIADDMDRGKDPINADEE